MEPVESLKQEVKTKLEQTIEQLFTQMSEMEACSLEKDRKIDKLVNSIKETSRDLEFFKAAYKRKIDEITQLQNELQKLKLQEQGDPELIIIYQPQDVFNYPRDIIRWYFNELDFKRLSVVNLIASLKGLIDLVDCEMADELIFHVSDDRLISIKEKELLEILTLLGVYLQAQFEKGFYSSVGIFHLMDSIYKQRWTPLLKDFVEDNRTYLENIIFKIDESSFIIQEPITLLKIYFELQLHTEAEAWLEEIFRSVIPPESLEIKDAVEFLYLSLIYEQEEKALDFIPNLKSRLQKDTLPELRAIRIFQEAYKRKENANQALQNLSALNKEATHINPQIKLKVFDQMIQRLKVVAAEEERRKAQVQNQYHRLVSNKKSEPESKKEVSSKQIPSVIRINNGVSSCPYDFTRLTLTNYMLAKYTDKEKTVISQYVPVQLLHCPTCNKAYLNHSMESNLSLLVSLKYLDIAQYVPGISKPVSHHTSSHSKPIAEPEIKTSQEPLNLSDHYGDKWQEESPLKKLGYSTNLTKQERWDILINKAVPKLGYERVSNYLSWFIEDKRKIKHKDFSRAISIWEDDLKRLYELRANQILKRG